MFMLSRILNLIIHLNVLQLYKMMYKVHTDHISELVWKQFKLNKKKCIKVWVCSARIKRTDNRVIGPGCASHNIFELFFF